MTDLLILSVVTENADDAELETLTLNLSEEVGLLEVDSIERPRGGDVPPGARAVDAAVLGSLLVKLGATPLKSLISVVKRWLARSKATSVELLLDGDSI